MVRVISQLAIVASLAVGVSVATPAVSAPLKPVDIGAVLGSNVDQVSFWGQPYPYGFAYNTRNCVRHVRVQTSKGWRSKRVNVCR